MTIQGTRDTLNRLSPDELQGRWMTNYSQMMVQTAMLVVPASIDKRELDGLSDDKIKKLIHDRMISALEDKLSTLRGGERWIK